MGLKKVELVLENCEVLEFDPQDVMIEFEPIRFSHMFEIGNTIFVRNTLIIIKDIAKCKGLWSKTWKDRLKTPDITAFYLDDRRFVVEWPEDEFYLNPYQHYFEGQSQIRIVISESKKFVKKSTLRMTR